MCFLKHSISAWGKRKSPWQSLSMDLKGWYTWKLATAEERKKHFEQVDIMNCSHGQNSLKWAVIFKADSRKKHKFFLSIFTESWTLLLNLPVPSKTNLKNIIMHLKMRSGNLEMPIKARFMHCITGRMFHSHEEVQVHSKRKAKTILRAMLQ